MNAQAAILRQASGRTPDWIDENNRALHRAIAEKIRGRPHLLGIAVENLRHWRRKGDPALRPLLKRWKLILLTWELDDILEFLTDASHEAAKLRRNSPFCGVLTDAEQQQALTDRH